MLLRRRHDRLQLGERLLAPEPLDGLRESAERHAEDRPLLEADRNQIVAADARHTGDSLVTRIRASTFARLLCG